MEGTCGWSTTRPSRAAPTDDDARTSLPLALYAIAAARMFRATCTRVELHHVPTGSVAVHTHTTESLERKLAEAESIAADLRRADADFAERGPESTRFAPADVGPVHLVRLPRPLPRGAAGRSGEVLLGGARGRERPHPSRQSETPDPPPTRLAPRRAATARQPRPDASASGLRAIRTRPVAESDTASEGHADLGPGDLVAAFVCLRGELRLRPSRCARRSPRHRGRRGRTRRWPPRGRAVAVLVGLQHDGEVLVPVLGDTGDDSLLHQLVAAARRAASAGRGAGP